MNRITAVVVYIRTRVYRTDGVVYYIYYIVASSAAESAMALAETFDTRCTHNRFPSVHAYIIKVMSPRVRVLWVCERLHDAWVVGGYIILANSSFDALRA